MYSICLVMILAPRFADVHASICFPFGLANMFAVNICICVFSNDSPHELRERLRIYDFPMVWFTFSLKIYVFLVFGNNYRHAARERLFIDSSVWLTLLQ